MKLGLTGGIACGKTTALDFFKRQGFSCLSSDSIVSQIYATDQELLDWIRENFGAGVFDASGALHRPSLAALVFKRENALEMLENKLHPRIGEVWQNALNNEPEKRWLVEIPLLFEKKLEKYFDYTLCISTHPSEQIARLRKRNWTEAHARLRLARQMPLTQKVNLADFVVCNDGTPEFFEKQLSCLLQKQLNYKN